MPDSLKDTPELWPGLALYYNAFFDLHGCRQLGDAVGPIDWITIDRYCERYELEGEQYEAMHYFLGRMDHAYLERDRSRTAKRMEQIERQAQAHSRRKPTAAPRPRRRR